MSNFIKEYYRRKRIKDSVQVKAEFFTNLRDVESVSYVYNLVSPSDLADVMDVHTFLKWKNVKIRALLIESKKDLLLKDDNIEAIRSENGIHIVGYNELDWLGDLKKDVASDYFETESNLFINFNSDPNYTLSRVAQRVKASMKCGMRNEDGIPYNLIVGDKDGAVLGNIEYLTQIFHYLKVFNK